MTQDVSPPPTLPQPQPQSSLSFSQGFLLGQLSIVLLLGAFIKFFIFGDAPSSPSRPSTSHSRTSRTPKPSTPNRTRTSSHSHSHSHPTPTSPADLHRTRSTILRPPAPPALTTSTLLSKTAYDVSTHAPESLDWFNVLIAQTLSQIRADAHADDAVLTSLSTVLNGAAKPDFLDEVRVTDLCLGEEFPRFRNCRVGFIGDEEAGGAGGEGVVGVGGGSTRGKGEGGDEGRLQARMDVDLSDDCITLALETKILLNYPKPRTAVLPVALSVSVVRFSGTLSVSFLPSSSSSNTSAHHPSSVPDTGLPTGVTGTAAAGSSPTTLSFTFLPDYELELSTRSLVGSRSRLQDVPKIAQIVESRLRAWFDERCVVPRVQMVVLPSLWPRKRNIGMRVSSGGSGGGGLGVGGVGDGGGEEEDDEEGPARRGGIEKGQVNREGEGLRWRGDGAR